MSVFMRQSDLAIVLGLPARSVRRAYAAMHGSAPRAYLTLRQAREIQAHILKKPNRVETATTAVLASRRDHRSFISTLVEEHGFIGPDGHVLLDWTYQDIGCCFNEQPTALFEDFAPLFNLFSVTSGVRVFKNTRRAAVGIEPYGLTLFEERTLQELVTNLEKKGALAPQKGIILAQRIERCTTCGEFLFHGDEGCIFCKAEKYL